LGRDQLGGNTLQKYDRPLVSVCIVTYNNPHTLKQAITSIEEQEYTNVELLVIFVNNTSTLLVVIINNK
jgi:glycosyltransferase involved in cell wall biosynthesis